MKILNTTSCSSFSVAQEEFLASFNVHIHFSTDVRISFKNLNKKENENNIG